MPVPQISVKGLYLSQNWKQIFLRVEENLHLFFKYCKSTLSWVLLTLFYLYISLYGLPILVILVLGLFIDRLIRFIAKLYQRPLNAALMIPEWQKQNSFYLFLSESMLILQIFAIPILVEYFFFATYPTSPFFDFKHV